MMFSRCCYVSQGVLLSKSYQSVILQSLRLRNYHVLGSSACNMPIRSDVNEIQINKTNFDRKLLMKISSSVHLPAHRNFAVTAITGSAATIPAVPVEQTAIPIIPDPPSLPSGAEEILVAGAEPTFASIGLGGYSPVGILQNALEFLHVSCDLPWWVTITVSTVIIRILLTPIVVISQRNAAKMQNIMPEMQKIQMKITEARQMGDAMAMAQYNQEMMAMMKEKNFNPLKNMLVPMAQMPIFLSFFIGLRRMVNAPVESLHTGGVLWFQDLTQADPYYILPIVTSATLALTIHLSTDAAKLNTGGSTSDLMNYFLKALPVVVFPFIMNFPAAMVVYWSASNFISLIQGSIFRIPKIRELCKIPQTKKFKPEELPMKKKGFVENVKGTWSNLKLSRELEDRRRVDEINFQRAAQGPVVRTYKFDPTKSRNVAMKKAN